MYQLSLIQIKVVYRAVNQSIREIEREYGENIAQNPIADKEHERLCDLYNDLHRIILDSRK
jgi:hypothetical protein